MLSISIRWTLCDRNRLARDRGMFMMIGGFSKQRFCIKGLAYQAVFLLFAAVGMPPVVAQQVDETRQPSSNLRGDAIEQVFPREHWEVRSPEQCNLDSDRLDAMALALGGRGCAIKNGYIVKSWGDQAQKSDLYSSSKPVLSTLLMFALQERKINSFDQPLVDFGWQLEAKDQTMTLRHLANMVSGYARPEAPGSAWAYNDYAIQLYQKTMFDKIFQAEPEVVFHDPKRFGALQLEDGFSFRKSNRRMSASVRDFARIVWLWLNRGRWHEHTLIEQQLFDQNMCPQVPEDLPNSIQAATRDYLKIGSYGGESNHFSLAGPGIYGFNWWFNATGARHPSSITWPDAPIDTVMSLGHKGNNSVIFPSLNFAVVALDAKWGDNQPGDKDSQINQNLKRIAEAGTER